MNTEEKVTQDEECRDYKRVSRKKNSGVSKNKNRKATRKKIAEKE